MLGFLKDRTRVLVTHNMALCVASADLVICLNSIPSSSAPNGATGSSRGEARSEVVACCPPSQLAGVIDSLRVKTSQSHIDSNGDVSVFLEGLAAAAALLTKDTQLVTPALMLSNPAAASSLDAGEEVDGGYGSWAAPEMDTCDESPRTMSLRRQNFSYESLRKGIATVAHNLDAADSSMNPTHDSVSGADIVHSSDIPQGNYVSAPSALSPILQTTQPGTEASAAVHTPARVTFAGSSTAITSTLSVTAAAGTAGSIVVVEGKSVGTVGWEVYWFYFKACGGVRAVVGLVLGTAFTSLAW